MTPRWSSFRITHVLLSVSLDLVRAFCSHSSDHKRFAWCWFAVGPPSQTSPQHQTNIRSTSRDCRTGVNCTSPAADAVLWESKLQFQLFLEFTLIYNNYLQRWLRHLNLFDKLTTSNLRKIRAFKNQVIVKISPFTALPSLAIIDDSTPGKLRYLQD